MSQQVLQFTFTFESLAEAEQFLAAMRFSVPRQLVDQAATALADAAATSLPAPIAVVGKQEAHASVATGAAQEPKKPRGRPRKDSTTPATPDSATAAAPNAGTANAEANPASSTPTTTADDVREALYTLTSAPGKSMADGLAVLKEFGAARVPELDPGVYGQVVAACQKRAAA